MISYWVRRKKEGKSNKQVVTGLTLSHLSQHFFQGVPIVYQNMRLDLGFTYIQIGLMTGVINIFGGFLQIVYSIAGQRFSRRFLLGGSNILVGFGCLMTGLADSFATVLGGSVVSGVGLAGQHPVSVSILADKYEGKAGIGTALSTFYGLGYVGNIISPILLSTVALLYGWRSSYFLLMLVPVSTGLLVILSLRGEPAGDKVVPKQTRRNLIQEIRSSLKVKGAISILIAWSIVSGGTGMGVMTTWVPMFLMDPTKGLGMSVFWAGVLSSVATIGGVLGTIYLGRIADRRGYLKTAMVSMAVTTVTIYLLTYYNYFNVLIIPNLFILSMTTFSLTSLLQAHLTSVSNKAEREILIGLFFTIGSGVSSLWSTVLGFLIDKYSFNAVWLTMASGGVVALLFLYNAFRGLDIN